MTIAASSEEEELLYYIKLFLYAFVQLWLQNLYNSLDSYFNCDSLAKKKKHDFDWQHYYFCKRFYRYCNNVVLNSFGQITISGKLTIKDA